MALKLFFFSTDNIKSIFNFDKRNFARIGFPKKVKASQTFPD